ncbi:MAG: transglutaminase domain-containing protein [Ruminococcaceae bacterium]|nr:transglutaminase domain-containing protein [Oscillospiraceae bacterium]
MYLPVEKLPFLAISLPEEVKMYHYAGDFEGEIKVIDRWLTKDLPLSQRKRLEIQRLFAEQLLTDYELDETAFVKMLKAHEPAVTPDIVDMLIKKGNLDFIMKGSVRHFQHQAVTNTINRHGDLLASLGNPQHQPADHSQSGLETICEMQEMGGMSYRYEVEEWIKLCPHAERPGETLRLWFPFPVACDTQPESEIKLISSSHPVAITGSVHRTAFMEVPCEAGATYSVTFSFVQRATYKDLSGSKPTGLPAGLGLSPEDLEAYTSEQYPHIRFTPTVMALANEIRGEERDPLRLAKRVYDWICDNVRYSYVRDYLLIENIPEFVMVNRYGDCGTMALTFITLCRALGIPAKWQSGSSCRPDGIGSHDWCMFYVAPYGWLYCDPSYGEGAARSGNMVRREYYFGNLDPYRLVASNEFQQPLTPDKKLCRMDPYDNQSGEAEYADGIHNIFFSDRTHGRRVIKAEKLTY